jgi:hypothetical protein
MSLRAYLIFVGCNMPDPRIITVGNDAKSLLEYLRNNCQYDIIEKHPDWIWSSSNYNNALKLTQHGCRRTPEDVEDEDDIFLSDAATVNEEDTRHSNGYYYRSFVLHPSDWTRLSTHTNSGNCSCRMDVYLATSKFDIDNVETMLEPIVDSII